MTRSRIGVALALALFVTRPALAVTGTCTITRLDVAGSIPFGNVGAVGVPLGTDVSGGTFSLDRTPFDDAYPPPGVTYFTVAVDSYLTIGRGVVTGTVDSTGHVVIPNVDVTLGTSFGTVMGEPPTLFPLTVTLMSGLQTPIQSGRPLLVEGSPIDPSTGSLHIIGLNFLNFQMSSITGPGITCTMAPIPDLSTLAAGPSLKSVKGKATIGTDPAASDDTLTLTAKLQHGETAPALDGTQDVILRLRGAGDALVTAVLVRKGVLTVKGKKATAKDVDGTTIEVVTPADSEVPAVPLSGGTLTIKRGKKASTLVWKLEGAGLDGFTGTVNVAVAVGQQTTSRDVTVTSAKKGLKFK